MSETDDRLVGDHVWEVYPATRRPTSRGALATRLGVFVVLIIGGLWVHPPLGAYFFCVGVAWGDFAQGRTAWRGIPDRWVGFVSACFHFAWGFWKLGVSAFACLFVLTVIDLKSEEPPPGVPGAVAISLGGFCLAAVLTVLGIVGALRGGLVIWLGEGFNRAKTLLLSMLIVGFVLGFLIPLCLLLVDDSRPILNLLTFAALYGGMFVGPVILLLTRDLLEQRILADRPIEYGRKGPLIGKPGAWRPLP
ncbi:MAG: hypothetical protein AB7I30_00600 [Isosphaeraceae bacterium]